MSKHEADEEADPDRHLCIICDIRPREIRVQCGHLFGCSLCMKHVSRCAICMGEITATYNIQGTSDSSGGGYISSGSDTYAGGLDDVCCACSKRSRFRFDCSECMRGHIVLCEECVHGWWCPSCLRPGSEEDFVARADSPQSSGSSCPPDPSVSTRAGSSSVQSPLEELSRSLRPRSPRTQPPRPRSPRTPPLAASGLQPVAKAAASGLQPADGSQRFAASVPFTVDVAQTGEHSFRFTHANAEWPLVTDLKILPLPAWHESPVMSESMEMIVRECCHTNTIFELVDNVEDPSIDRGVLSLEVCKRCIAISKCHPKAIILAPTVPMARQIMESATEFGCLRCQCVIGNAKVDSWGEEEWKCRVSDNDVIITQPQLFLDALDKEFLHLSAFCLMVIEECQHCSGHHPFARIFKRHYIRTSDHIRILGLSSCIVKPKKINSAERWKAIENMTRLMCCVYQNSSTIDYHAPKNKSWMSSLAQHSHTPIAPTEIALLTRLPSHENAVHVRDVFFSPYFCVMVSPTLDTDLWHVLNKHSDSGGLQPGVATRITDLVARGAAHLHLNNIIHRDLHAGDILISFKGGLPIAIKGGLQPANLVGRVCIADFGQSCDTHGSKHLVKRSVGMCASCITPPEIYFALKGCGHTPYDSSVDVWAMGVNLVLMIAGYQKFVKWHHPDEYLEFWRNIIGKVPATDANRMKWNLKNWAVRSGYQQLPFAGGPHQLSELKPACPPIGCATPMSRTAASRQCSRHHLLLLYNPIHRPVAADIHRLFVDLSEHAASESGNVLAASSGLAASSN